MRRDSETRTRTGTFRDYPEPKPPSRHPRHLSEDHEDPSKRPHSPPMVMPGPTEEVQTEISLIGVEGKPADAKAGPGSLLMTLGVYLGVIVIAAIVAGFLVSWVTGLVVFGVGCLGMLLNPLFATTLLRARDRQDVADHHLPHDKRMN